PRTEIQWPTKKNRLSKLTSRWQVSLAWSGSAGGSVRWIIGAAIRHATCPCVTWSLCGRCSAWTSHCMITKRGEHRAGEPSPTLSGLTQPLARLAGDAPRYLTTSHRSRDDDASKVGSVDMDILVIGCGVSGLTCGVRLLEAGHRVTIWARDLPPNTTSNVAAAVWEPYRATQLAAAPRRARAPITLSLGLPA